MCVLDVSTSCRAPLANSNGLHLVVANRSVQCQTKKSDTVRTTTVEKADAGTLDWCLDSAMSPLGTKQQSSEHRLRSNIIYNGEFASRPSEAPQAWRHVYCIHCVLMGKVYYIAPLGTLPSLSQLSLLHYASFKYWKSHDFMPNYCNLKKCSSYNV